MPVLKPEEEKLLKDMYANFNKREIDAVLKNLDKEVDWPNGMEGGTEHGHDAVRNYWTRQWKLVDPNVEPVSFSRENDGRINVTVHQVVHDLQGKLLVDQMIHHIYTIKNGLVTTMEIRS